MSDKKEKNIKNNGLPAVSINWYPGHMKKTKDEIKNNINLIDVVYELVDARIPYSSKIKDIDNIIKNKKRILIMTKYDICDKGETDKWIKYYEDNGYYVIKANLNSNDFIKELVNKTNMLMEDENNKRIEKGMETKITKVLVIGIPNVGKSTLINKLAGKSVSNVGNMPGVTKNLSWLKTNYNILILDTPGILWPKFDNNTIALNLASMTAIKSEVLDIDSVSIYILNMLDKYYNDILINRYGINFVNNNDILETYDLIGKKIGAIVSGGEIDYNRVSNYVLNDIKKENVRNITFDRIDDYE